MITVGGRALRSTVALALALVSPGLAPYQALAASGRQATKIQGVSLPVAPVSALAVRSHDKITVAS